QKPLMLYAKDIDNNGSIDLLPAYYIKNSEGAFDLFPAIDRTQFAEEVPAIKKNYLLNSDYAAANIKQILALMDNKGLVELKCETNASVWIENLGNSKFKIHPLPVQAQFAPINGILADDFDGDGNIDLLTAGNEYQIEISSGRYDASYGLLLKGNGKGSFIPVTSAASGFIVDGDVKNIKVIDNKVHGKMVLASVNNDCLRCFSVRKY
ncbi:MAG: hypothetical protein ABIS01_14255, partial [Ferruginibacter sp.]